MHEHEEKSESGLVDRRGYVGCYVCRFNFNVWSSPAIGDKGTYLRHENSADHKEAVAVLIQKFKHRYISITETDKKTNITTEMKKIEQPIRSKLVGIWT